MVTFKTKKRVNAPFSSDIGKQVTLYKYMEVQVYGCISIRPSYKYMEKGKNPYK